jgi:phosphatidylinositol alpha-1,6-mannosyltransferase
MEALARGLALPRRAAGEPLRVLCSSSLWAGKGQDVLLAAAARARRAGAELELVLAAAGGTEVFRRRVEELARVPELRGRVRFRAGLSRPELSAELARAHVFALPSTWAEPFSLALLEALAHGLAVVASDAGGSPEALRHGEDGWLVPAADEEALAGALLRLERDEGLRARLGQRARERAAELSHARWVDGLVQALERVRAPRGERR